MTNRTASLPAPSPPQSASQPDYAAKWIAACQVLESVVSALEVEFDRDGPDGRHRCRHSGEAGRGRRYMDKHVPELLELLREVER